MPSKHKKVYHKSKKDKTTYKKQLKKWENIIQEQLPVLSKSQGYILALWSFSMIVIKSCSITSVSFFLAFLLEDNDELIDTKQNSWRQRLREFCYDCNDKRGHKRRDLDVQACFPYLVKWIVKWWDSNQLAIALDATTLGLKFTVLAVSIVYRSCSIPVAWTITKGNEKGEWNTHWFRMLKDIKGNMCLSTGKWFSRTFDDPT